MKLSSLLFLFNLLVYFHASISISKAAELPEWVGESVGVPVRTARCWTTALSPNPRGGYNFIAQYFNVGSGMLSLRERWVEMRNQNLFHPDSISSLTLTPSFRKVKES